MPKKHQTAILWIRQCLRIADNPALKQALALAENIIPVYIYAPHEEGHWGIGEASQWWLHHSLLALQEAYQHKNADLILRQGNTLAILEQLVKETGASLVVYDTRLEPHALAQEHKITSILQQQGIETQGLLCNFLFHPETIQNQQGKPFKVFTPFYKHTQTFCPPVFQAENPPGTVPFNLSTKPYTLQLDDLQLLPTLNWASQFSETGIPGEAGALRRLQLFAESAVSHYPEHRDRPDMDGVSKLSPALHFGELSPRQIANMVTGLPNADVYYRQLVWREFAHYILYHFPDTDTQPFQKQFETFPWQENASYLKRWQQGETGYPIIDAGMRELWATGWMHNRVRMLVASFLTKDLLINWQEGAKWFWDTLTDADLANNSMGWQWTAGCGVDAAPYFRVFNPVLQAEKFDPNGEYIRKWIPELRHLPKQFIHKPWTATLFEKHYPEPIIDHMQAKEMALAAYQQTKLIKPGLA